MLVKFPFKIVGDRAINLIHMKQIPNLMIFVENSVFMSIKQSQKNLYLPHKDCRRKKKSGFVSETETKTEQSIGLRFGLCLFDRNQIFSL